MAREITTYGNICSGKLHIIQRDQFMVALGDWKDGAVELVVRYLYGKRSNAQNAYYHSVCVPLIRAAMEESIGETLTHAETHEWLKRQFNARQILTANGLSLTLSGETKALSTVDFADYIERCRQFAADSLCIDIPDPARIEAAKHELKL